MILLDTDLCIELLRGNKKVMKKRAAFPGDVAISFMAVGELYYGARNSGFPKENELLVEKFILTIPVIQTDIPILKRFGELKARLKKNNLLLPDADILSPRSLWRKRMRLSPETRGILNGSTV